MFTKKFSEHHMVLGTNALVLMFQFFMIVEPQDDVVLVVLLLGFFVGGGIPMMIYAYCDVKLNNYLVNNGQLITAKIHHEETKVGYIGRGGAILQLQCIYMENDVVHIFKDQYFVGKYGAKQIMDLLRQADTVDVLVDAEYKKYKVLFRSVFHDMYRDYDECPAFLNYVLLVVNIGCAIVNFL